MKKPRADNKIFALKESQRAQLDDWFRDENVTYAEAKKRLKTKFKVAVSERALGDYWKQHFARPRFLQAVELAKVINLPSDKFDPVIAKSLRQKIFELSLDKETDIEALKLLVSALSDLEKIRIKQQEMSLAERKVVLLEKKAAQAEEAAGVMGDESLTPAEKEAKCLEIFGIRGRDERPARPQEEKA
jgi:hypothetical protein